MVEQIYVLVFYKIIWRNWVLSAMLVFTV